MNEPGPFDKLLRQQPRRSDRGPTYVLVAILVLGLILLILVLPPISILSGGDDDGGGSSADVSVKAVPREDMPPLPDGFTAVSPLYDISVAGTVDGPTIVTLQLPQVVDNPLNLSLYTYDGKEWQRLTAAVLTLNGTAAQGEVSELPKNLAVLRAATNTHQIGGWLPAGRQLHPEAANTLSVLNPAGLGPAADGSLVGQATDFPADQPFEVYPSIRVQTQQHLDAANGIIGSPDLRNAHVNAILQMVEAGSYDGVDIDYGQLDPLRKDELSDFVGALADQLHRRGLGMTLTVPLPAQEGTTWNSGAYDWPLLAQAVDAIRLIPEPDPSRYYRRMEQVLEHLIKDQEVDPAKLVLVLSPWAHEKGGEGIRILGLLEALMTASAVKAESEQARPGEEVNIVGENVYTDDGASGVKWDEEAAAVSYSYPGLGGERTVWIENSFSFLFRLNLVSRFHLAGVALEDVSKEPGVGDIWPVLRDFSAAGKVSLVKPNGTMLAPHWEIDGGTIKDGGNGTAVWTAPETSGMYHVTLIVSDGLARLGRRLTLTVKD